jgi:predicted dehydrogenase
MAKEKEPIKDNGEQESKTGVSTRRRSLIKALAGIPVLGLLAWSVLEKRSYDKRKGNNIVKDLGLESLQDPDLVKIKEMKKGDLIRIGIVGWGVRGGQLSKALGFLHPNEEKNMRASKRIESWLEQEDLNVAITGVCDVFDLHAEKGLAIASSELRPGGGKASGLPVKRYRSYHDMLNDKDIDAVIISVPDHHHARFATEGIKAGKHVYCEKSVTLKESELNELYEAVEGSDKVYQLGHQYVKNSIFTYAKEIIDKEVLGKISLVETTTNRNTSHGAWIRHLDAKGNPKPGDLDSIDWDQWLGETPKVPFSTDRFYNWTKWFDYDSGLIGQLFSHEFDAINQLLSIGIPSSVVSSGGIYRWKDNREMADVFHSVFEYPDKDMTLIYSGNLSSSLPRGRVLQGNDASMELGSSLIVHADKNSEKYAGMIKDGIIDPKHAMISFDPNAGPIDAVTSATEAYYASRGLIDTSIGGKQIDITHLHLREWIDCIRNGGVPSANIEKAYEEGIASVMAHRSYVEKRRVEWDPIQKKII